MATKIVTKNSSTASAVPTASDLVQGELAVNVADKRLFTEDNGGAIVELGTNPYNFTANYNGSAKLTTTATGIDVTGTATVDGLVVDGNAVIDGGATDNTVLTLDSGTPNTYLKITDSNSTNGAFIGATTNDLNLYPNNTLSAKFSAGGDISFYEDTGTTAKFFWDASAESLGIGTSSPSAPLHTYKNNTSAYNLFQGNAGSWVFGQADGKCQVGGLLGTHTGMVVDTSGNVGIGTSLPSGKTHSVAANNQVAVMAGGDVSDPLYPAFGFDGQIGSNGGRGAGMYLPSDGTLAWSTAGTERMRIDSSGLLKIGTSGTVTPYSLSKFAIDTGTYAYMDLLSTGSSGINFGDAGSAQRGTIEYNHVSDYMRFGSAGAERMRIDTSGNLFVGKTSVSLTTAGVRLAPNGGSEFVSQGNNNTVLNIGSTNDSYISLVGFFTSGGTQCGYILGDGSAVSLVSLSDYRLKEDWHPIVNATQSLMQLKPYNFAWKADGSRTDGFLAHELQEVVPTAAHGVKNELDSDGNPKYQGIDQSKLVPLLVATIQELEARLTALENN